MLVLTRRLNEEIVIAGNIRVTVLECNGRHVRLGIAAPAAVSIDRQEVHERRALLLSASAQPATDQLTMPQTEAPATACPLVLASAD